MKDHFKFTKIQIPFTSTKFEQNLKEFRKRKSKGTCCDGSYNFPKFS